MLDIILLTRKYCPSSLCYGVLQSLRRDHNLLALFIFYMNFLTLTAILHVLITVTEAEVSRMSWARRWQRGWVPNYLIVKNHFRWRLEGVCERACLINGRLRR